MNKILLACTIVLLAALTAGGWWGYQELTQLKAERRSQEDFLKYLNEQLDEKEAAFDVANEQVEDCNERWTSEHNLREKCSEALESAGRAIKKLEGELAKMHPIYQEHVEKQELLKKQKGQGAQCMTRAECLSHLTCWARRCVPKFKVGHGCETDADCGVGYCSDGKCSIGEKGHSCERDRDCQSGNCNEAMFSDSVGRCE